MLKKLWNIITTLLVIIFVVIALSLVAIKLVGGGAYTVLSGSMEPTYHVGSLIYVQKVDADKLRENDPITFALTEDVVVTHRIVKIINSDEGLEFITKGDANDSNDANPVNYRNIIGKPIVSIPYLGYAINYIQHPPGMYLMVGLIALLLLINLILSMFEKK